MLIALIIIDKSIFCINTDIDFILSDIFNNTIEYKN